MRFLWPWGGSLLDSKFKCNLSDPKSQEGLEFRLKLMKYMPPGIVDFDHSEAVNALAQGQVAMITEWSAFYQTLVDPKTSKIVNSLGIAPEPKGPDGRKPALGGFSLAVTTQVDDKKKGAAWLFIQWLTSKAKAKEYVENGGVSGRQSTYQDKDLVAKYPFIPPMVESWQQGVPEYRPRFAEWPQLSDIIAEWGTKMMDGQSTVKQASDQICKLVEDTLKKGRLLRRQEAVSTMRRESVRNVRAEFRPAAAPAGSGRRAVPTLPRNVGTGQREQDLRRARSRHARRSDSAG